MNGDPQYGAAGLARELGIVSERTQSHVAQQLEAEAAFFQDASQHSLQPRLVTFQVRGVRCNDPPAAPAPVSPAPAVADPFATQLASRIAFKHFVIHVVSAFKCTAARTASEYSRKGINRSPPPPATFPRHS